MLGFDDMTLRESRENACVAWRRIHHSQLITNFARQQQTTDNPLSRTRGAVVIVLWKGFHER
jgi:hypothetical protein